MELIESLPGQGEVIRAVSHYISTSTSDSPLTNLGDIDDDGDVLNDLIRRIDWLELQDGPGYDAAIKFYKRIVERINNETIQ